MNKSITKIQVGQIGSSDRIILTDGELQATKLNKSYWNHIKLIK